ncbi:MAG: hypothetical protein K6G81_05180 [Lachnospiraceae bacterium]|nr:hypothetical protein [Lachnospiraceae bacterium]
MSLKYWESMSAREKAEKELKAAPRVVRLETPDEPKMTCAVVKETGNENSEAKNVIDQGKRMPVFFSVLISVFAFLGITLLLILTAFLGAVLILGALGSAGLGGTALYYGFTNLPVSVPVSFELIGIGLCFIALGVMAFALGLGTFIKPVRYIAGLYRRELLAVGLTDRNNKRSKK